GCPGAPGWAGSPTPPPAAAAVPEIRAPVPARRSRQRLLHRVEDSFRHVALVQERQLERRAALPDDRDAIRGDFKPRAGLERVVQDDVVEMLLAQLRLGPCHAVLPCRSRRLQGEPDHYAPVGGLERGEDVGRRLELERERAVGARALPGRGLGGAIVGRGRRHDQQVRVLQTGVPGTLCASRRAAAASPASGSLIRPGRSLGPSASGPVSGPMKCHPRPASVFTLARVAAWAYMASFMAGAASTGPVRARSRAVSTSSASPSAARASRCAVAGATIARSGWRASAMCASARSGCHREVRTGRPVSASKVTGRTNSAADAVSTTSTAAPPSASRRASVQLLYPAIPPAPP